jgi:serine/threonine-protein kinase HipA
VVTPRTGKMTLAYRPEVIERVGAGSLVLSAALPARVGRYSPSEAAPFLDGLLPDGSARAGLERRFAVHRVDGFSLLAALGRECAGAVSLVPQGEPGPIAWVATDDRVVLDDRTIAARLAGLAEDPFGVDDATRLTLAGTVWKLPLARATDGGWSAPTAGHWSTHLLRPEPPERRGLVATEAFALAVMRLAGLRVVDAEARTFGGRPVLVVSRFDRVIAADGTVTRRHQEDCCQALGAERGERAERNGGPTLAEVAGLVGDLASDPEAELVHLLGWLAASAVFGKVDGTARDLALSYPTHDDGVVGCEMAPISSMAGTADYAEQAGALGLSIDGVADLDRVGSKQVVAEAARWGMPADVVTPLVADLLVALDGALDAARDVSDPGDDVVAACRTRIARLMPA